MAAASLFWDANVAAVTDAVKKRFHQKEIQAFPNCYFAFSVWYQSGKICLDQAVHAASAFHRMSLYTKQDDLRS